MRKLFGTILVLLVVIALAVIPTALGANLKSTPPLKVKTQITLQELVVPGGTALVRGKITNSSKSSLRFLSIEMMASSDGYGFNGEDWADIVGGSLPVAPSRFTAAITMLKAGKSLSFTLRVKVPPRNELSAFSYWCLKANVFQGNWSPYAYSNRTCAAIVATQPKKK